MTNRIDLGVDSATSAPTPPQISNAERATEAALRHALKTDRHNRAALYQLAALLVARGELKQGAKFLAQLCELARETPALWLELSRPRLYAITVGPRTGSDVPAIHSQSRRDRRGPVSISPGSRGTSGAMIGASAGIIHVRVARTKRAAAARRNGLSSGSPPSFTKSQTPQPGLFCGA